MKKKFIFIALLLFILSFILTSAYADKLLGYNVVDNISYVFLWTIILTPLSVFALTLNDQKHKFWLKFTGIFFTISMFIVFLMPEYGTGIVSIDRELTNWFFVGLYSFISIIYFIVQFTKRKDNQQEKKEKGYFI